MSPEGDEPDYQWSRQGRSLTAIVVVAAIWLLLIIGYVVFDAALLILFILAVFTLPALYDLGANPHAGLSLERDGLHWFSGRRAGQLAYVEIDHIRLDTRLDFSVRATAVLRSGRKIRLPFESTPPHRELEAALGARGLRTRRHHFAPIG